MRTVRRTVRLILFHNVGQNQGWLGVARAKLSQPTNCGEGQQQTDRSNGSPNVVRDMRRWNWENYKYFLTKNRFNYLANKNIFI